MSAPRLSRPWTPPEDAILRRLLAGPRLTDAVLAAKLEAESDTAPPRTVMAVAARRKLLCARQTDPASLAALFPRWADTAGGRRVSEPDRMLFGCWVRRVFGAEVAA